MEPIQNPESHVHEQTLGQNRLLEMIPATLTWGTLIMAVAMSFWQPLWVIVFILFFDVYWLFRVGYFVFYLTISWRHYREDILVDWNTKIKELPHAKDITHLIFLPTAGEEYGVIQATLSGLARCKFDKSRMYVVLAGEERFAEHFKENAALAVAEFGSTFGSFVTTLHPKDIPGEAKAKGANMNFAARQVKRDVIDVEKIPYENIVVSAFDIDTIVHPQYFAYLTYKFCTVSDPLHTSYQPIALYNNNVWESSMIVRIAAFGTTFWLMSELSRPERLYTFSSHSMPFTALVDVDYWQNNIVTEDSRIFLQCFMRYDGNYRVTPLYMPVSMDAVRGATYRKTLVSLYKQQRRWAWGVEHFPYMAIEFSRHKTIPLRKKIKYFWNLTEGMYSWATAPLLIFILGRLPFYVGSKQLESSLLFARTPHILSILMLLSIAGIFISMVLMVKLLPPRPDKVSRVRKLGMFLQWAFLPFTITLLSVPALDAQTRLALGKYLGFSVTEKIRKEKTNADKVLR